MAGFISGLWARTAWGSTADHGLPSHPYSHLPEYPTQGSMEAGPNCEPDDVLSGLLEPWSELLAEGSRKAVKLTMVHTSRKAAFDPVLCNPTYVLTLTSDP